MEKKTFFRSFVWRLHRANFAIIVICFLGTMTLIALINYTQVLKKLENRAESTVELASISLRDALGNEDSTALREVVEALLKNNDVVAIKVLPNQMENVIQIKDFLKEHTFDALIYQSGLIAKETLVVKNGKGVGRVHIVLDANEAIKGSLLYLWILVASMLVMVVLLGISSWLGFYKSIQPAIVDLIDNMDQMLTGEVFGMDVNRSDELGDLARQFSTMYSSVQNKIGNLQMVNTTVGLLAMSSDQTRALEIGMEMMQIQTNVDRGSVYLLDSNQKLKVCAFYPQLGSDHAVSSKEFQIGEGILGQAAEKQEIIYVPDTSQHSEFIAEGTNPASPKALLCVPMLDQRKVFGVMNFSGTVGNVKYSTKDGDDRIAMTIARLTMLVTKMLSISGENPTSVNSKIQ